MRAREFLTEGEYDKATYDLPRRQLNVPELIRRGAIFITEPHGVNGWESNGYGHSLITLYNVLQGPSWSAEAKQHLKPSEYANAAKIYNSPVTKSRLIDGKYNQILWSIEKLGIPDNIAFLDKQQGVAEGLEQQYLWHGSTQEIPMLTPRQAQDTGGAAGSNQNAIYATSDPKVAVTMGLTERGSDTAMFPNDPQMVLFSGKIRRGEKVYLHKLPFNGPDGKPQFVQGGNSREFHSVPGVKGIKPVEIKAVLVDKYLNLIRQATPADLELQKKYMKQGLTESEARLDPRVEEFLDGLTPDDVGVDTVGDYRVHYEGFTDLCKSSSDYIEDPEAVYDDVWHDFKAREGDRDPINYGMVGSEEYPILYSVFRVK